MGSPNDRDKMAPAVKTLTEFGLEPDERVLSAHRTPDAVVEMARGARDNGYVAFICGAGMAAAAAAAVAPKLASRRPVMPRPRRAWPAAVDRTPAAVRAQGMQKGALFGPWAYTRQSVQKSRRQERHMPLASSNRCLSH